MAIKYQFNKTALNDLNKQLKVRQQALPTIKSKESALRMEVKKAKTASEEYAQKMKDLFERYDHMVALWTEFQMDIVEIKEVKMSRQKIAGVTTPSLDGIVFLEKEYSLFCAPYWYADGIKLLKNMVCLGLEHEFYLYKIQSLENARKKTTQKVNLYEKVQIPGYEDAIRKIRRFLEDEENIAKSSQKIVKQRQEESA